MPTNLFALHEIQTRYVARPDLGYLPAELVARVATPQGAAAVALHYLSGQEVEHTIAILLSAALKTLCIAVISKGTADSVSAMPRDVFREAVRHNAVGVILAHNHPSGGGTQPSNADKEVTRVCKAAGELLGITFYDHLIVADGCQPFSLREAGLL